MKSRGSILLDAYESPIVYPNINNRYAVGEKCGIETFTCNSIRDSVAYFHSIAVLVDNGTIYQQLNIKLSNEQCQFNCTISPFDEVGNVVFDGLINPLNNTESMIEIYGPIQNATTSVLISGISFNNFNNSVIIILSNDQYANVTIDQCNFNNYKTQKNVHMIGFTRYWAPVGNGSTLTGTITISNITNITNNGGGFTSNGVLYSYGINITLLNVIISNITSQIQTLLYVENSIVNISNCNFNNVNTFIGAIQSRGSNIVMYNSTFNSLSSTNGGALLNHDIESTNQVSSFNITDCKVLNCYSQVGNGVIQLFNIFSLDLIFSSGSLTVTNSTIINVLEESREKAQIYSGTVIFNNSTILFDGCSFGKEYFSISCYKSNIEFSNSNNLNPFYICIQCNQLTVNSNSICKQSSTTSTLNFDSDSSDSIKLISNNFSIFFIIVLIIIITTTNNNLF
ncbi:hypothetical protein ACTFIY_009990 [Dictyostelium cf. discoideum]